MTDPALSDAAIPPARRRGLLRGCLIAVAVVVAAAIGYVAWIGHAFRQATTPVEDPGEYADIVRVRKQSDPDGYAFFPDAIDPAAERVAFYHLPGFMQGGDIVALRLRLPPARVAEIVRSLESQGRLELPPSRQMNAGDSIPRFEGEAAPAPQGPYGMPPDPLAAGYRIFNFGATPEDIEENWNHNFRAFVAVSVERSEVVWYADRW